MPARKEKPGKKKDEREREPNVSPLLIIIMIGEGSGGRLRGGDAQRRCR